jgi:membrane protease YdiL (CAAX protease family)
MDLQLLKYRSTASRIVVLVLLCLSIGFIIVSLGMVFLSFFVDGSLETMMTQISQMESKRDILFMKYIQMITQFGFFLLPAIIFAFLIRKDIATYFNIKKIPSIKIGLLAVIIIFVSNPFIEWLVYKNNQIQLPDFLNHLEIWMRQTEEAAAIATNKFLQMAHFSDYLLNILMIGVLAALSEELLFRGILQPMFIKVFKSHHLGIWFAAVVFSFIHFQFYGFFARLFLGAVLGYSYHYSKNLWVPIIAHFFNNSLAVTYVYLSKEPLYNTSQGIIHIEETNIFYALIGLSLAVLGLIILRHYSQKSENNLK